MAVISYANGETKTGAIDLVDDSTQLEVATGTATQEGAISETGGSFGFEKTGAGTLNLTGDNTYTGPTTISAGALHLDPASGSVLTDSDFAIANGATLSFASGLFFADIGALSGAGDVDLGTDLVLTSYNDVGEDTVFSGSIFDQSGTDPDQGAYFIACGGGLLTLTGDSEFGGIFEVDYEGFVNIDGGSVTSDNTDQSQTIISGTLHILNGGSLTTTWIQNARGTLIVDGEGSTATASDWTSISWVLSVENGGVVTSEAGGYVGSTGVAATATVSGIGSEWNITGILEIGFDNTTFPVLSELGDVTVAASGKITVGGIEIATQDSSLRIGTGGIAGSLEADTIANEGAIIADFTDATTLDADTSGDGTLTKDGVGTLTLTGTSTYTGGTILDGGSIAITNGSALGTGELAMAEGTRILLDGSFTLDIDITIEGDPTFEVAGGDTSTITGVIADGSEAGILEKTGGGTLVLDAPNTYSGGTIISAGILRATTGTGTGSSSVGTGTVTLDGGRFQAGSSDVGFANNFAINATGGTIDTNGRDVIIAGNVGEGSGAGGTLTKAGLGVLTIKGSSTYSGDTIVSAGELFAQSNTALSQFSAYTVSAGATLRIDVDQNNAIGSLAGGGAVTIGDGAKLTAGVNGKNTTFSGGIAGNGDFTKTGAGTLILSGTSSHTGEMTVDDGTLRVDGAIVAATSVGDGATLAGRGTTGAVNIASGGTLAPGASAGNITTGDFTFAAGATFEVEVGGTAPGTGYDRATVNGAVTLAGATLDLTFIGGFVPAFGNSYTIVLNDGSDAVSGTFAGLAEGETFLIGGRLMSITYQGGDGNDVVIAKTPPPTTIVGTAGKDLIDATHTVAGQPLPTAGEDLIQGLGNNDTIDALGGADQVSGGNGKDTIAGGDGNDSVKGNKGGDTLSGDAGNDVIVGAKGNDLLKGGDGDDWLNGGRGNNKLFGGEGEDTFVFRTRKATDTVKDFADGDIIALAKSAFHGIGPKGVLKAKYFHIGDEAETRKQHILYDEDSGWLLYAKKGSGTANPLAFAKIGKHLDDFDHHDILVI
jgi:fibronectin-binding autotransporter adhesin